VFRTPLSNFACFFSLFFFLWWFILSRLKRTRPICVTLSFNALLLFPVPQTSFSFFIPLSYPLRLAKGVPSSTGLTISASRSRHPFSGLAVFCLYIKLIDDPCSTFRCPPQHCQYGVLLLLDFLFTVVYSFFQFLWTVYM